MEKAIYFETYPLGTIAVSKISAVIAYVSVFFEMFDNAYWLIPIYTVLYLLAFIYNVKLRAATCKYYGKTIHSKSGTFFQRFPPKIDENSASEGSNALTAVAILSYIVILFPAAVAIYLFIITPIEFLGLRVTITFAIYLIALIIPSFILKKKIVAGVCEL